jgi:uncharacterized protein
MKRTLLDNLFVWKNGTSRKPLILQGARQVGKTWLMREFGRLAYEQVVYLNFEQNARLKNLFVQDFEISRILTVLSIESGIRLSPENTLILFDEIQVAERGITALKYFYETAPEWHIIAAGSLLGVSLQPGTTFPVGKVDFMRLYPLSFFEFLDSMGQSLLAEQIQAHNWSVVNDYHEHLVTLVRLYYYVGGMPEVVAAYALNKDLQQVRQLQLNILAGYENDVAKYAPTNVVPRIRMVWQTLLSQIAKENKKYIYAQIKPGARAKDFEDAINWLKDAGLITKVHEVTKPELPLKAYANFDTFKLFMLDIGLLNAQAELDAKILLEKNRVLTEYKGALTEQFVFQQLTPHFDLFYWTAPRATAEIDFLLQYSNRPIPIEVKAEENLKAKSLKVFSEKFQIPLALRTSMAMYKEQDWMVNFPLYAVGREMVERVSGG